MRVFCGEIYYETTEGGVQSDICKHEEGPISDEYRKFLHDCLDEWLNKSEGTGVFWIGDYAYFWQWCEDKGDK